MNELDELLDILKENFVYFKININTVNSVYKTIRLNSYSLNLYLTPVLNSEILVINIYELSRILYADIEDILYNLQYVYSQYLDNGISPQPIYILHPNNNIDNIINCMYFDLNVIIRLMFVIVSDYSFMLSEELSKIMVNYLTNGFIIDPLTVLSDNKSLIGFDNVVKQYINRKV